MTKPRDDWDAWDKVLNDPRVRGPLEEEEAQRIQAEHDWDKPVEKKEPVEVA